jgi:hypothetical protein
VVPRLRRRAPLERVLEEEGSSGRVPVVLGEPEIECRLAPGRYRVRASSGRKPIAELDLVAGERLHVNVPPDRG